MKVFKDVFTGDELLSDSYHITTPFDNEAWKGAAYEVKTRKIQKGGETYGITDNSTEEDGATGGLADTQETVIDIIDAFNLQEISLSRPEFKAYAKQYMKRLKTYLEEKKPDRVEIFQEVAKNVITHVLKEFDEFSFYVGESNDTEASLVYGYYKGEEPAPRLIYIADGMKEEKF